MLYLSSHGGMMNSAGVFAVSNVRSTLIGVKWLKRNVSTGMVLGQADSLLSFGT